MPRSIPTEVRRALGALALLRLKATDIEQVHQYLRSTSTFELTTALRSFEAALLNKGRAVEEPTPGYESPGSDAVLSQALTLLRDGTGMTNSQIVEAMNKELNESNRLDVANVKKYDARKALVEWLRAILATVGPSDLLKFATKIREQAVKPDRPHWSLERGE